MKYWVFDLDGTLVDSLRIHFEILEKIFNKFDLEFSSAQYEEVLKVTAKTLPQYFKAKLGADNTPLALDMFHEMNSQAFNLIQAFPGIEELLKTLQSHNKKLAVWTARDLVAMTQILDNTGLSSYFSICVSGSCTEQGKPHPEGLKKIADHFNCDAGAMVMVGDFDSDMLGAQAFGTKAVRVFWHSVVQIKECQIADWQFHQVSEFNDWINARINATTNAISPLTNSV